MLYFFRIDNLFYCSDIIYICFQLWAKFSESGPVVWPTVRHSVYQNSSVIINLKLVVLEDSLAAFACSMVYGLLLNHLRANL